MLGGDWSDPMYDQSDILGNPGPIYRAYPRRAKVRDADCYSFLKVIIQEARCNVFVGGKRKLTIEVLATTCKIGARGVMFLAKRFDDQP